MVGESVVIRTVRVCQRSLARSRAASEHRARRRQRAGGVQRVNFMTGDAIHTTSPLSAGCFADPAYMPNFG